MKKITSDLYQELLEAINAWEKIRFPPAKAKAAHVVFTTYRKLLKYKSDISEPQMKRIDRAVGMIDTAEKERKANQRKSKTPTKPKRSSYNGR